MTPKNIIFWAVVALIVFGVVVVGLGSPKHHPTPKDGFHLDMAEDYSHSSEHYHPHQNEHYHPHQNEHYDERYREYSGVKPYIYPDAYNPFDTVPGSNPDDTITHSWNDIAASPAMGANPAGIGMGRYFSDWSA